MTAFVSVIIPTYNGAGFLPEAIESIQRQAYQPLEIIVVDDGSTDHTAALSHQFQSNVSYLYQANRGPAAARNAGLRKAHGEVIAFLDADDLWEQDALTCRLARLLAGSANAPEVEIVLGLTQRLNLTRRVEGQPIFAALLPPWATTLLGGALFRKSVFARVGLFDESLRYGEDVDWFLRAREQGIAMTFLKRVTLLYRIHESNMTNDTAVSDVTFIRALHKSLTRRRQVGNGAVQGLVPPGGLHELVKEMRPEAIRQAREGRQRDLLSGV